jgi:hypothetical protein
MQPVRQSAKGMPELLEPPQAFLVVVAVLAVPPGRQPPRLAEVLEGPAKPLT